jgi:hypothetical protein
VAAAKRERLWAACHLQLVISNERSARAFLEQGKARSLVFGKYGFRVTANFILNTKFNYDPMKLTPEQRATYTLIINGCYDDNGTPVDAAIMFMLVQANTATGASRKGPFVERIFSVIEQLKHEMSPQAYTKLGGWTAEFIAESDQQAVETEHETFKRHFGGMVAGG